ncbi:hypothetical protein DsansV1_C35g0231641 [Dioscorea sansibarensis]
MLYLGHLSVVVRLRIKANMKIVSIQNIFKCKLQNRFKRKKLIEIKICREKKDKICW